MNSIFKKYSLFIVCLAIVSFSSCKDDDDDNAAPAATAQTATQKLTGKDFLMTNYSYKVNDVEEASFADFDECDKDDITRFETNGSMIFDEGAIKCDSTDAQTETYSWAFLSNNTKLTLDFGDNDVETYDILINDGTTLKLEITDEEDVDGDMIDDDTVETLTFTKK